MNEGGFVMIVKILMAAIYATMPILCFYEGWFCGEIWGKACFFAVGIPCIGIMLYILSDNKN